MDFEAYLISKKIDGEWFSTAEPDVWKAWKLEFEQVHPNSFTAQKLYLINPLRRKYTLKVGLVPMPPVKNTEQQPDNAGVTASPATTQVNPKPAIPRPVFKPKPKPT